jgi:hypothetical protein
VTFLPVPEVALVEFRGLRIGHQPMEKY